MLYCFRETWYFVWKIENSDQLQLPQTFINFVEILHPTVYKRVCGIFFILFRTWVICQNQKIHGFYTLTETRFINNSGSKQNKKNSTHLFVDICKMEKCAKFQQKQFNSMVGGAYRSFQFFRLTWFLGNTRALSKFKYWILHHLISIIKLQNTGILSIGFLSW